MNDLSRFLLSRAADVLAGYSINMSSASLSGLTALSATEFTLNGVTITSWPSSGSGSGGGGGTVTSVGLTAPDIFSVGGSPVTVSGTLALMLATQAANKIWAGPTSGAAANPTFRALVAADIPDLSSIYLALNSELGTAYIRFQECFIFESAVGENLVFWNDDDGVGCFMDSGGGFNIGGLSGSPVPAGITIGVPAITLNQDGSASLATGNCTIGPSGNVSANGMNFLGAFATASEPSYVAGAFYYNTDTGKLMVGGTTKWDTVTSV